MKSFFNSLIIVLFFFGVNELNAQMEILQLVKDIHNSDDRYPSGMSAFGDKLLFIASDSAHGYEPWISDGTAAGTFMIKDINPGESDALSTSTMYFDNYSNNYFLPLPGGKMVFPADDGVHGRELWITDGTEPGTHLIKDINPGADPSYLYHRIPFNNRIFFRAGNSGTTLKLWVTDGTETGTFQFMDISLENATYAVAGDKLYFACDSSGSGSEPWVTDGTAEGTHILRDIRPGIYASSPEYFAPFGDKVIFTADSAIYGREPWISDGTAEGTHLLKDIKPGNNGSSSNPATSGARYYFEFNGRLYFSAELNDETGSELWVTDGTEAGTYEFKTLNPSMTGTVDGSPGQFIIYNSTLFFKGRSDISYNDAIWKSDGTEDGTVNLIDGADGIFHNFNNKLYYFSEDWIGFTTGSTGIPVTITNATTTPIRLAMQQTSDKLFVVAKLSSDVGYELYRITDPTAIISFQENDLLLYPNPANNRVYLSGLKPSGNTSRITISDITGRVIISEIIQANNSISVNIDGIEAGTYIIAVGNTSRKFIKQNL